MDFKEFLKNNNIPYFLDNNEKLNEIKSDCLEMARLKSDFDIDKFTVATQGKFIAHRFHFLMRQYSLALYEAKRLLLDREEKSRQIKEWQEGKKVEGKYSDIEIERLKNEIELIDLELANKLAMIDRFEKARLKLIEQNGKKFTDEQYQNEEPKYWKWYLLNKAKEQLGERQTGINAGVWMNVRNMEEDALDSRNKVKMLKDTNVNGKIVSGFDFSEIEDIEKDIKKLK